MNDDKKHHRKVTVVSLLFMLALYLAMRLGVLGGILQNFSTAYLIFMLVLLGLRSLLTEMGIRRKRFGFEGRLQK